MSDMFLRDVKADIDETDEEVLIVGDSYLQQWCLNHHESTSTIVPYILL